MVKHIEVPSVRVADPLLSVDLGNAYAKIATELFSGEFRAIGGRLSKKRRHGDFVSPLAFTFGGETWVFGDDARRLCDGEPTFLTDMSRYTSGFYRRLMAAALWWSFVEDSNHYRGEIVLHPRIVSSIPVQEFADGRVDLIRESLAGEYEILSVSVLDGVPLHVNILPENLTIIPEGVGAYTMGLSEVKGAGACEVAILDVGYYTTDLTIFDKGVYVSSAAASLKAGIGQVAEGVAAFLRRGHSYNGDVWAVDDRLDDGCINVGKNCVQFTDVRDDAYADLVDDLARFFVSKRGSRMPAFTFLTGGRSAALLPFVPEELTSVSTWRALGARSNVDGAMAFLRRKVGAK